MTQKILHEIKYRGKSDLAMSMGRWYGEILGEIHADIMLPVPLHKSKLKRRTFNQSKKIAEGLSEKLDLKIRDDLVQRIKMTSTQTSMTRTERWKNMENVFSSVEEDLDGKSVVVVDDVITTGATIGMICERLVQANVKEIHLLSIARGR